MTYADEEFILEGQNETPNYPTAFGITFTPKVSGILIGVLGLLGATYLLLNLVLPAWEKYQTLDTEVKSKQGQIQNKQQIQKQIAQAKLKLEQAKQKNREVLSLFPTQKTLDTLIVDLNNPIKSRNARLISFAPVKEAQSGGNDNAAPIPGNGKLKRVTYNMSFEGSFGQVQSILRSFERLQSLLVVRDFKTELSDDQGFLINSNGRVTPAIFKKEGRQIIPDGQPTIKTTFKLDALVPVSTEEGKDAAATQPKPKPKQ